MSNLLNDLRLGARLLLKNPGYSMVVTLTLALAIGANTLVFGFTDLLLLRPLPFGPRGFHVQRQRAAQRPSLENAPSRFSRLARSIIIVRGDGGFRARATDRREDVRPTR